MIVLGVDPDTQCSGIAIVHGDKVVCVAVADVRKHVGAKAVIAMAAELPKVMLQLPWQGVSRVVVEDQQFYRSGKADANSLILLSKVSGAALTAAPLIVPIRNVVLVKPKDWKGQLPKRVHHKRLEAKFGQIEDMPGGKLIPKAHHKEVWDAIGLADWGQTRRGL